MQATEKKEEKWIEEEKVVSLIAGEEIKRTVHHSRFSETEAGSMHNQAGSMHNQAGSMHNPLLLLLLAVVVVVLPSSQSWCFFLHLP